MEEKRGLLAMPGNDGPLVLLFRMGGLLVHVGLLIERPYFLHTLPGRNSVLESYLSPTWGPRLAGAFRPIPGGA